MRKATGGAEKRSVSLPASLADRAQRRADALGYVKFSHYLQALIRADVYGTPAHQMVEMPKHERVNALELNEESRTLLKEKALRALKESKKDQPKPN